MTPHQLKLTRRLAASPEEVYAAWTDPAHLAEWLVPIAGGRTQMRNEARVGGAYRIDMFRPDGEVLPHEGEYLRLVPPSLVEFSWNSHATAQLRSVVTVELKAVGSDETELTLTHRLLPSEASVADHIGGWTAGLDRLAAWIRLPTARRRGSYRRELLLDAPVAVVVRALSTTEGLRGWWTRTADAGGEGAVTSVRFGTTAKRFRVERLTPNRSVRWHCIEAHLDAPGLRRADEWVGTSPIFRFAERGAGQTTLYFEHLGLTPDLDCHALCTAGWDQFLGSLKRYVETGQGSPWTAPADCATAA